MDDGQLRTASPLSTTLYLLLGGRRTRRKARGKQQRNEGHVVSKDREKERGRGREREEGKSKEQKGTVQILVLSTSHFRSWPHSANGRPQAGANGTQLNDSYQRAPPVALAGMSRTRWQCRDCAAAAEAHGGPRLIRCRGEDESRKISAASNSISLVEGNGS